MFINNLKQIKIVFKYILSTVKNEFEIKINILFYGYIHIFIMHQMLLLITIFFTLDII